MLHFIKTINPELGNKEIYIYGVSENSIKVILWLALRKIYIKGIVTKNISFWNQSFINIPIISFEEYIKKTNVILLHENNLLFEEKNYIEQFSIAYSLDNVVCYNPQLFDLNRNYYIYGTGNTAWDLYKKISTTGIDIDAFIETKPRHKKFGKLEVQSLEEILPNPNASIIVAVLDEEIEFEIFHNIEASSFKGDIFIYGYEEKFGNSILQTIDLAVKNNKKIILNCDDILYSDIYKSFFDAYDISLYKEFKNNDSESNDCPINYFSDFSADDFMLIIHNLNDVQRYRLIAEACEAGFSVDNGNLASFQHIIRNPRFVNKNLYYEKDWHLKGNVNYSISGGIPGWMIYGNKDNTKNTIAIIGNSTSSESYSNENWISKLYKKYDKDQVTIYNGCFEGDDELFELYRIVKDINIIKPKIVISFSGCNSIKKRDIFDMEIGFERWKEKEKLINFLCDINQIKFYSFLQPFNRYMPDMNLEETAKFFRFNEYELAKEMYEKSTKNDFYYNLIDIFFHNEEMYVDSSHYTEKAHEIIADNVYRIIEKDIY